MANTKLVKRVAKSGVPNATGNMDFTNFKIPSNLIRPGFHKVPSKHSGVSLISFVANPVANADYIASEPKKVTGLCQYHFLSSAEVIRGILIVSPAAHTVLKPTMVKIGTCAGEEFLMNQNLQQLGILIYESSDSGVVLIPVDVKSPLLVEVDT